MNGPHHHALSNQQVSVSFICGESAPLIAICTSQVAINLIK